MFLVARRERRGRRECVASLALASGMKGSLFNTNGHELPVNFREYFLAELLLHADGTESTDIVYFLINFTMQSIQTGVEEIVSTKTFAGCISSK